jgi:cardiolipin synthase A/B
MRALLLLLALPLASASPLLVAVVPDLPGTAAGDEGFAVASTGQADLTGWTVGDGETEWAFPPGTLLQPGVPLWVVGNATAWAAHDGRAALAASGLVRLGNEGDQLELRRPDGTLADSFSYGDGADLDPPASPGLVLQRLTQGTGWIDTDDGADWRTPRLHRIGESSLARPAFEAERLTLYASPDSSFGVLSGLVAGATQRLHLHVYEFRSAELADALVAAKRAHPALDLQVLVDGNPVGMTLDERHATADALRRVQEAGGRVVLAGNGRYDDHHLKVLVADGAVAVQSENWVPSGVPEDPSWGNRGWGAVVHDDAAADWFARWMQADRDAWDVAEFALPTFDPGFVAPARVEPRRGAYAPVPAVELTGSFRVAPVIAPDHTQDPNGEPVSALVAAAVRRVDAQQLDLSLTGRNALGWAGPDPLTSALAQAASHGAQVHVQAAAPFAADDAGNAQALAWLEERGAEARTFDRDGLATLHNKGLVADDAAVVGSMNGNLHSRAQNREVALVLEGPGVADHYAALAALDWDAADPPRDWSVPGKDLRGLPGAPWPTLLAILAVGCILARRWS